MVMISRKERIDAYSKLATGTLTAALAYIGLKPLLTGDFGKEHDGFQESPLTRMATHFTDTLDHVPFMWLAVAASLIPVAWELSKFVPRKVVIDQLKIRQLTWPHPNSWSVPIGRTVHGRWVWHSLAKSPHLKVGGATGAGKTEALIAYQTVLLMAHEPKDLDVLIVDLKGGASFAEFENLSNVVVVDSPEDAIDALEGVKAIIKDRLAIIKKHRKAFQEPPYFKRIVVIVDEGAELSCVDETLELLSYLVRIGREPCVNVIFGTQRPEKEVLPLQIRSQFESTFAFRVNEDYDSQILLRHKGAEELPQIPGRMLYQTPSREIIVQGSYIPRDVLHAWIKTMMNNPDVSTVSPPLDKVVHVGGSEATSGHGKVLEFVRRE